MSEPNEDQPKDIETKQREVMTEAALFLVELHARMRDHASVPITVSGARWWRDNANQRLEFMEGSESVVPELMLSDQWGNVTFNLRKTKEALTRMIEKAEGA